jgi:hypothetical protein
VSVTVTCLIPHIVNEEDRRIGWIDRPFVGTVVHEDGFAFEIEDQFLRVFHKNEDILALYAPGAWFSVVNNNPTEAS